ncbi:MAG: DUF1772 domain-containing protein [Solirubrobacteraceae bacterium]
MATTDAWRAGTGACRILSCTETQQPGVTVYNLLRFLNVACCGIVTGTYTFEMVVVVPATNAAPAEQSAHIHRALFKNLPNRFMPWLGITGGASAIYMLARPGDAVSKRARRLYAVGVPAWLATFIILVGFSRPLDKEISTMAETRVDENEYWAARKRWDRLMFSRGPLGLLGLSAFIAAALTK